MICVVLPAAHSAPDFFYFFFICLRRDRNYSALHRFFCCTLNWIFFPPPLVQSTLLTCNICFWSRGRLSHLFTRPLADFSERYGSRKVSRQRFWKRPPPSFFKPVYPPPPSRFFFLANASYWRPCASFLYLFPPPLVFERYCPACDNFMQGKHRVWAIYVRKLVWNQHICEHDSPGAFLWSIIYVLWRAKKLYLKINFSAIPVILSLKGNGVYWVFMLMPGMNVKLEMKSI